MTLNYYLEKLKDLPDSLNACKYHRRKKWQKMSWRQIYYLVESISGALIASGLKAGDHAAIWGETSLEWWVLDLAMIKAGIISVPLYHNCSTDEAEFICKQSEIKAIFLGCEDQVQNWDKIKRSLPPQIMSFCLSTPHDWDENLPSWEEFIELGENFMDKNPGFFSNTDQDLNPSNPVTLVYTSGTTGIPRGFYLNHIQILSELKDVFGLLEIDKTDQALSFLPYSHIMGRLEGWGALYCNYTLAFSRGVNHIRSDLKEINPTVLMAVPRIFEKIFEYVRSQTKIYRVGDIAFKRAERTAREMSHCKMLRRSPPLGTLAEFLVFDQLIFSKVRAALGNKLRFALSGGAPLNQELIEFFHGAGVLILQGYGLTETTGAITLNSPESYRHGSTGRALPEVQLKIAADGEVLVKSEKVTCQEIDAQPDQNQDAEGYFKTGDIGYLDEDGFLFLTDRKKDLIKTSNGKYVAPQKLENLLRHYELISQAIVYGDDKKYIVVGLTLNREKVIQFAAKRELSFQNFENLTQHPRVFDEISRYILEVNQRLAPHETIKRYLILPQELTVESGELTPSFKVKRKACIEKFRSLFESLY